MHQDTNGNGEHWQMVTFKPMVTGRNSLTTIDVIGADWGGQKEGNLCNMVHLGKGELSLWSFGNCSGGVN